MRLSCLCGRVLRGLRYSSLPLRGRAGVGALAAFLAALLLLLSPLAHAIEVTDDRGLHLAIPRAPQRIVSLMPSLTETVCALGACARLVGVDDYSNWPPFADALPHVGGLEDARVEAIVALKPDLVLAPTSSRALPRLQALGLPVLALEPRTLADVRRVLQVLGPVLEAGDPQEVWQRINHDVQLAAQRLPTARRGTRVYVEVGSTPYAASEASFIGELLTRLGVENIVPGSLGPFPKLNPEFVVRANPQVIIIARRDAAGLRTRPGWGGVAALRSGRVCALEVDEINVLMRAGPRLGQGAQLLVDCLQGRLPAGSNGR